MTHIEHVEEAGQLLGKEAEYTAPSGKQGCCGVISAVRETRSISTFGLLEVEMAGSWFPWVQCKLLPMGPDSITIDVLFGDKPAFVTLNAAGIEKIRKAIAKAEHQARQR